MSSHKYVRTVALAFLLAISATQMLAQAIVGVLGIDNSRSVVGTHPGFGWIAASSIPVPFTAQGLQAAGI